ncbi:hypothetical protein ACQPW3_06085 [Actinosynnema sp. CA-248983]
MDANITHTSPNAIKNTAISAAPSGPSAGPITTSPGSNRTLSAYNSVSGHGITSATASGPGVNMARTNGITATS